MHRNVSRSYDRGHIQTDTLRVSRNDGGGSSQSGREDHELADCDKQ
jgi:hypothetical protein